MYKVVEGQISFGGIHDALEAVSRLKDVKNGVLRISSHDASGLVGIFCGRFITGAVMTLSGESGYSALKKLLAAQDGTFAFLDAGNEVLPDLKQSLSIDIQMILASPNVNELPVTDEGLTSLGEAPEEIKLIDTNAELPDAPVTEDQRLDRIQRTYERLLTLSEFKKQMGEPSTDVHTALGGRYESPDAGTYRAAEEPSIRQDFSRADLTSAPRELPRQQVRQAEQPPVDLPQVERQRPPIPAWDVPYEPPSQQDADPSTTFSRLKKWSHTGGAYKGVVIAVIAVVVLALLILLGPKLLAVFTHH